MIDHPFNTNKAQRANKMEEYKQRNNALNMAMSQKFLTNLGATHNSVHMRQKVGGTHNTHDNFATAKTRPLAVKSCDKRIMFPCNEICNIFIKNLLMFMKWLRYFWISPSRVKLFIF